MENGEGRRVKGEQENGERRKEKGKGTFHDGGCGYETLELLELWNFWNSTRLR